MTKYFYFILFIVIGSCQPQSEEYWFISGEAMGTRYNITGSNGDAEEIQSAIEELLAEFNESLSTYIPESRISKFNQADSVFSFSLTEDRFFLPVLERTSEIFDKTGGAFDPTVMPLLEFYGFGSIRNPAGPKMMERRDSIMKLIGFHKISWQVKDQLIAVAKKHPGVQLNFNSIAKGYGVDLVAELLKRIGVKNYLVEIGGEVRSEGVSSRGDEWRLGINTPHPEARLQEYLLTLKVSNIGMATSGNYRDFYIENDRKYVHIIDPRTGKNEESTLASATIIAKDCATADAYATASIVLGLEEALRIINQLPDVEGCFITLDSGNYNVHLTDNFNEYIYE